MSLVGNHIKTLRRRLAFLEARLAGGHHSEKSLNFLKAERSALLWALVILQAVLSPSKPKNETEH